MATLHWIGKEAVVNHHLEVPYRLLMADPKLSVGDEDHPQGVGSGNLLVQGDNLEALKALLPYYAGKVKCIYIDPPYNTGNEGWAYNDNVNSPEIRAWLGKVVGKEGETLDRHDRWLCMMYPRLALLREFLRDDGIIFVSIGKDEYGNLRGLCDEVFGVRCHVETLIWHTEGHTENQERITAVHEYVMVYERMPDTTPIRDIVDPNVPDDSKIRRDFAENSITKNGRGNPPSIVELPVGFPCEVENLTLPSFAQAKSFMSEVAAIGYITRQLTDKFRAEYPVRLDDMVVRKSTLAKPCRVYSGWASAKKLAAFISNDCKMIQDEGTQLGYSLSKNGVIYYRREGRTSRWVQTVLERMGTTEKNRYELEAMGVHFTYPKPKELISYLISLASERDDIVMDSFFGSGTTGHSVALQNRSDGEKRRFVGIELDPAIAKDCAAARLTAVLNGYVVRTGQRRGEKVEGLGGGFRYVTLGEPLFDEHGSIKDQVRFADLAAHVFFTETGEPAPPQKKNGKRSPLIGVYRGTAYYLLFNGILGDETPKGGNVLTSETLARLPSHNGPRIVFGEACRLGEERLRRAGVTFKQIPYQVRGARK